MATTLNPRNNINFYLALPINLLDTREDTYTITVKLPADTEFPSDLTDLVTETKRVISFDEIVGKTDAGTIVCTNTECAGYSAPEQIIYSIKPFYPPRTTYLYDYKPKIGLVKYVSTIMSSIPPSTVSPSSLLSENDFAIFRISYDSKDFKDLDSFKKLYDSVVDNQNYLVMLNEKSFIEHNLGALQRIQKTNNISVGTLQPLKKSQVTQLLKGTMRPEKLTQRPGAVGGRVVMTGTPRPLTGTPRPVQMKLQVGGKEVSMGPRKMMNFNQR